MGGLNMKTLLLAAGIAGGLFASYLAAPATNAG